MHILYVLYTHIFILYICMYRHTHTYIKIITQKKTSKSRHLPALAWSYHCISRTFLYLLPVILRHRLSPIGFIGL